jgi:hypothetical protein
MGYDERRQEHTSQKRKEISEDQGSTLHPSFCLAGGDICTQLLLFIPVAGDQFLRLVLLI